MVQTGLSLGGPQELDNSSRAMDIFPTPTVIYIDTPTVESTVPQERSTEKLSEFSNSKYLGFLRYAVALLERNGCIETLASRRCKVCYHSLGSVKDVADNPLCNCVALDSGMLTQPQGRIKQPEALCTTTG